MSSTTTGPPRRMRRFASTSVLDSNYSGAANVSTAPPHNSLRTLSNITNQPLTTRARSHSQTAYDTKQQPGPQRFAKKAQSQANLQPKQHSTIESLISSPPASLAEALVELRYLILTEGVTADLDGNVCINMTNFHIYYIYTNIVETESLQTPSLPSEFISGPFFSA